MCSLYYMMKDKPAWKREWAMNVPGLKTVGPFIIRAEIAMTDVLASRSR
jgi:hypothetical protein